MSDKTDVRITLEYEDFLTLVSGGVVTRTGPDTHQTQVILADIGWDRLINAVRLAMFGSDS